MERISRPNGGRRIEFVQRTTGGAERCHGLRPRGFHGGVDVGQHAARITPNQVNTAMKDLEPAGAHPGADALLAQPPLQ